MRASCPRSTLLTKSPFWLYGSAVLTFSNNAQKTDMWYLPDMNWLGPHRDGVLQSNELSAGYRIHNHGSIHAPNCRYNFLTFCLPGWFQRTLSCIIQESNSYFYASDESVKCPTLRFRPFHCWYPCIYALWHLGVACSATTMWNCQQSQGPDLMGKPVGWDIYSTNLAWPSWTTSMENYLQVTNLDNIILPCHGMPWGDLVPVPQPSSLLKQPTLATRAIDGFRSGLNVLFSSTFIILQSELLTPDFAEQPIPPMLPMLHQMKLSWIYWCQ